MNKTEIAVDIFNRNAKPYMDKFMDVSLYNEGFDIFCKSVKPNAEVLELACGPGNVTKYLLDKRADLKILGTDLAPNMIELAKQNNPGAEFRILNCKDIAETGKKFNAIMCAFALPYLSKEEAVQFIKDAYGALTPCGTVYISTMEDDYTKSDWKAGSTGEKIFMHYHELGYLQKALEDEGFTITYMRRQPFTNHDGTKAIDLILIAEKP